MTEGLGGEKDRWNKAAKAAETDLLRLPGDTLLAAASLAYLAPHLPSIRWGHIRLILSIISYTLYNQWDIIYFFHEEL